jgi:hypothetical protein
VKKLPGSGPAGTPIVASGSRSRLGIGTLAGSAGRSKTVMVTLEKSEAEVLEQLLNGDRLWSWPNGRIQLAQTFPDPAVINRLVRVGLLNQNYEPTASGRLALESWLTGETLPASILPGSSAGTRQSRSPR